MIQRLIWGFVSILVGVSLVGPISTQVNTASATNGALYNSSTWGASILNMVPGFFALSLLGVGVALVVGSLRDAGIAG